MKHLLSRLFGSRAATVPSRIAPQPVAESPEALRQRLDEPLSDAERPTHERALGQALGKAGITPGAADTPTVWIQAISAATDRDVAGAWLDALTSEADLEAVILSARLAEIRLLAAQRITDLQRLNRLASLMRDKDRRVYRHCQSVLRRQADLARRTTQVEQLRQAFERLIGQRPIAPGALCDLRKRLAELEDGDDLADCQALLKQANQFEQEEATALKALDGWMAEARGWLKTLRHALPKNELAAARLACQTLSERLAGWPPALANHPGPGQLQGLLQDCNARLLALDEDARRSAAAGLWLAECAGQPLTPELCAAWENLPKPEQSAARVALDAAWAARQAHATASAPRPARPVNPTALPAATLRQRLDELEQALESGESQQAMALARALEQMTANAHVPRQLDSRYRALLARVGQLRDWARWSAEQARNQLLEAAEALNNGPTNLEQLADSVPKLREEWRRLEGLSRATQAQWQRFDQALNQAYQPVLDERAERHARLDHIGQAKSGLLDEAEQWLASLAEQPMPPGELQRRLRALRQHWRGLAKAGPRDERRLQNRFRALMSALEERLEPFIQAETERRQRLIASAMRLRNEPNLPETATQARLLQQRWRDEASGVHLPRQTDVTQWQRFREAVDAVFARRDADRQEHETQRQAWRAQRQALLATLAEVLQTKPGQAQIEAALASFDAAWEAGIAEGQSRRRDDLDTAAAALTDQAQAMIEARRAARQQALLELIVRKAGWADAREAAAVAGQPADTDLEAQWQSAPTLPADLEQLLAERFTQAPGMTAGKLADGHRRREALLIDLEILLDLPTPPAFASARQQRQLEWLQSGFHALKEPAALLHQLGIWYGTAATPDEDHAQRISRVTEALARRFME